MNERVKLLAEQAWVYQVRVLNEPDGSRTYTEKEKVFDKEKFAELVVQECMACSTWVGRMNKTAIEPVHTAYTINQRIKEHFGVEE